MNFLRKGIIFGALLTFLFGASIFGPKKAEAKPNPFVINPIKTEQDSGKILKLDDVAKEDCGVCPDGYRVFGTDANGEILLALADTTGSPDQGTGDANNDASKKQNPFVVTLDEDSVIKYKKLCSDYTSATNADTKKQLGSQIEGLISSTIGDALKKGNDMVAITYQNRFEESCDCDLIQNSRKVVIENTADKRWTEALELRKTIPVKANGEYDETSKQYNDFMHSIGVISEEVKLLGDENSLFKKYRENLDLFRQSNLDLIAKNKQLTELLDNLETFLNEERSAPDTQVQDPAGDTKQDPAKKDQVNPDGVKKQDTTLVVPATQPNLDQLLAGEFTLAEKDYYRLLTDGYHMILQNGIESQKEMDDLSFLKGKYDAWKAKINEVIQSTDTQRYSQEFKNQRAEILKLIDQNVQEIDTAISRGPAMYDSGINGAASLGEFIKKTVGDDSKISNKGEFDEVKRTYDSVVKQRQLYDNLAGFWVLPDGKSFNEVAVKLGDIQTNIEALINAYMDEAAAAYKSVSDDFAAAQKLYATAPDDARKKIMDLGARAEALIVQYGSTEQFNFNDITKNIYKFAAGVNVPKQDSTSQEKPKAPDVDTTKTEGQDTTTKTEDPNAAEKKDSPDATIDSKLPGGTLPNQSNPSNGAANNYVAGQKDAQTKDQGTTPDSKKQTVVVKKDLADKHGFIYNIGHKATEGWNWYANQVKQNPFLTIGLTLGQAAVIAFAGYGVVKSVQAGKARAYARRQEQEAVQAA